MIEILTIVTAMNRIVNVVQRIALPRPLVLRSIPFVLLGLCGGALSGVSCAAVCVYIERRTISP